MEQEVPIRQAKQALLNLYGQHPGMGAVGLSALPDGRQCIQVEWDDEDHPLPRIWMGWPVRVVPPSDPVALRARPRGHPGKAFVWLSLLGAAAVGAGLGYATLWLTGCG